MKPLQIIIVTICLIVCSCITGSESKHPNPDNNASDTISDDPWVFSLGNLSERPTYKRVALAIDQNGFTYIVTGISGHIDNISGAELNSFNYGTSLIKLDQAGDILWSETFEFYSAVSIFLSVDDNGNSYICGQFFGEVDFDPGPDEDLRIAKKGVDAFLMKVNTDGNQEWTYTFGGGLQNQIEPHDDYISALNISYPDEIVLTGTYTDQIIFPTNQSVEIINTDGVGQFIVKISHDGIFKEAIVLDNCRAGDLVIDSNNNYLVSGEFNGQSDFDPGIGVHIETFLFKGFHESIGYIAKYNDQLEFQWVNQIPIIRAGNLAVNSKNEIYIWGFKDQDTKILELFPGFNDGGNNSFAIYDSEGNLIASRQIELSSSPNYITNVEIGINGKYYLTGGLRHGSDTVPQGFISEITPLGEIIWEYNFESGIHSVIDSIDTDEYGNIYIGGWYSESVTLPQCFDNETLQATYNNEAFFIKAHQECFD